MTKKEEFAQAVGHHVIDIFKTSFYNMPLLRGLYLDWRKEVTGMTESQLAITEGIKLPIVRYSLKSYRDRLSYGEKDAVRYRKKIEHLYPTMTIEEAKDILHLAIDTFEDDKIKSAIKRIIMK